MPNRIVCKFFVRDNWLESLIEWLKISSEEVWLNFSKLIEFYKSVLNDSLILLIKGLRHNCSHKWETLVEVFDLFALSNWQEIWDCLQGGKFDVKLLELECSLENASKFLFEFHQVVHDVSKEPVENNESSVDLSLVLTLNESEELVKQVLPNASILLLDHCTLNFHSYIANFVDQSLVSSINASQGLENDRLDRFTCRIW